MKVGKRRFGIICLLIQVGLGGCALLQTGNDLGHFHATRANGAILAMADSLRDPDARACIRAARELGALGARARPAVPHLARALADGDSRIRIAAAEALESIGPAAESALPALRGALNPKDPALCARAQLAMARITGRSREAARALESLGSDPDRSVALAARVALVRVGESPRAHLETFLAAIESESAELRLLGLHGLEASGSAAARAAPRLARHLGDRSPAVGRAAASALARMGPAGLDLLASALRDESGAARERATRGLGDLGAAASPVIPELLALLKGSAWRIRAAAAEALGSIAPRDPVVARALVSALRHDPDIRLSVGAGLANGGPQAARALCELLGDPDRRVARAAAEILLETGSPALPVLEEFGGSGSERSAVLGLQVLGGLSPDPTPAVERIAGYLAHASDRVRLDAVEALAYFGEEARAAVLSLVPLIDDRNPAISLAAIEALGAAGRSAREALPGLARLVSRGRGDVRGMAARALGRIGPGASDAVPELVDALGSGDRTLVRAAAVALGDIGPAASAAAGPLLALLDRPDTRTEALEALAKLGARAERVREELLEATRSDDARLALRASLWLIGLARSRGRPVWIRPLLDHSHPRVRAWAEQAVPRR